MTSAANTETVREYVDIFKRIDWMKGLTAIGILVVGLLIVRLILKGVQKWLARSGVPPTLHTMIRTLLRIFLDLVVILTAAGFIGIPITSFITLLGLFGLAISLAVQGVLSNLAGGFIILLSRPFEVGHLIEHDGVSGTVTEIRMMHTRVATPDGKMVYLPNGSLSGARVINFSETGKRRVEITVSASYENPPEQVRKAARAAMAAVDGILPEPEPVVAVDEYGDSAIQYTIWVWTRNEDFLTVKNDLKEKLYAAFAENGVEMTYPHLNVHVDGRSD